MSQKMEVVDGFNPFFQPDLWDGFSAWLTNNLDVHRGP